MYHFEPGQVCIFKLEGDLTLNQHGNSLEGTDWIFHSYETKSSTTLLIIWLLCSPGQSWHICASLSQWEKNVVQNTLCSWLTSKVGPLLVTNTVEHCKICVNTLRPRRNGRHFADDNFKCIYLNANILISNTLWLKFVPNGPIDNNRALVQITAWCRTGDKALSEPVMA